jgi:Protein of unknown function (DUF3667)/Domain of unknown function (DUF4286)
MNPDETPVVYDVALEADADIEREFDTWLRDHVADMLALPGFSSAEILVGTGPPSAPGRISRTVLYRLRDQASLEAYLRDHAPQMREQGALRFGDRFSVARRSLVQRAEMLAGRISTDNCLNCGEVLSGQYCSYCGQRARVRIISLWELLRDLVGDILDVDSRIWRTLAPLVFRPGLLTVEYLRGRRAQSTPPFRMYVILSLIFFLVVSVGSSGPVRFQFDDKNANVQLGAGDDDDDSTPSPTDTGIVASPASEAPPLDATALEAIDAAVARVPEDRREEARAALTRAMRGLSPSDRDAVGNRLQNPCSEENFHVDVPGLDRYESRAREACRKIVADSGASFARAVWENVPKMMFIFLPVLALANAVLYVGSRRYYVEHLLFFVHFHAFFFLLITLDVLVWRGAYLLQGGEEGSLSVAAGMFTAVIVFYVPIYLYKAMRRVFEQGRFVTLIKFSMLCIAYLVSLVLTLLGLLAYTALTI